MRRLSTRLLRQRRHPAAGLVVLLLGLLMTGGLYAVVSPATASSDASDTESVALGRELFLLGCAGCHGKNGEGIVNQGAESQYGPPLIGVGAAAVDFQVGTGRMPMQQPGAQAPDKEVTYTDEEVSQLAAYVASLGAGPAIPTEEQYDPQTIEDEEELEESVARGGEFYRTNCTACHNFAGAGGALSQGKYAPKLTGVDPVHVYEAMLTGPQNMPVFSDEVLRPEDKRDIIAYLEAIHDNPQYGGSELGSLGPVSEGMFAWIAGIGGCVAFAIWIASHTARVRRQGGAS